MMQWYTQIRLTNLRNTPQYVIGVSVVADLFSLLASENIITYFPFAEVEPMQGLSHFTEAVHEIPCFIHEFLIIAFEYCI